jgi:predicted Zn-dependent protease
MSEQVLKNVGISVAAAVFNLGQLSAELLNQAANLAVSLPYARKQESDADLVGLELAARSGHDPRIKEIEANLPSVLPLYRKTAKP